MRNPPIIIEMTGLPGAGKTTLSNAIIAKLKEKGFCIPDSEFLRKKRSFKLTHPSKVIKYLHFFIFCLQEWDWVIAVLKYSHQMKPFKRDRLKFSFVFLRTYYFLQRIINEKKYYDWIVLEEGLIQNLWAITIYGNSTKNLKPLLTLLKMIKKELPFVVIDVQIDVPTAINRIKNRSYGSGRFDRMELTKAEELLLIHEKHLLEIIKLLKEVGIVYYSVNGNDSLVQKRETIINIMKGSILTEE